MFVGLMTTHKYWLHLDSHIPPGREEQNTAIFDQKHMVALFLRAESGDGAINVLIITSQ